MILLGVVVVGIFIFAFVMSRRAKKATYFDRGLAQAETVAKTPALEPTSGEFSGRKRWRQLRTNEIVADVVANATPNSQVRVRHLPAKFHFSGRDK